MKSVFKFCPFSRWLMICGAAIEVIHSVTAIVVLRSDSIRLAALSGEFMANGMYALVVAAVISLIANFIVQSEKSV